MGKVSESGENSLVPDHLAIGKEAAAEYVAEMLHSMHHVALRTELLFLAYVLEVARQEAMAIASGKEPSRLIG